MNVENGFPIKNWYDDRNDKELYNITQLLEFLAYVPDVRDFIKRMTEKNEVAYSKAMALMNSFYQQEAYKQNIQASGLQNQSSKSKINTSHDFINKSAVNLNSYTPKDNLVRMDERDTRMSPLSQNQHNTQLSQQINNNKYNQNIITKERTLTKTPSQTGSAFQNYNLQNEPQNKLEADKQNISIVLINNHINRYIINGQETNQNQTNQLSHSQLNQMNLEKKAKNINTFRSSYTSQGQNYMSENQINKTREAPSKISTDIRQSNISQNNPGLSHNGSRVNLKHLKIGVEMRSPILKTPTPSDLQGPKYSSLIDNQNFRNTNLSSHSQGNRPSSAVAVKGRHARETSSGSYKSENLQNYHPVVRSPSSQNIAQGMNRNSSKSSLNQRKETPKNNYFISNYDVTKSMGMGNKTVRPSSTNDRIRMNYTSNISPLSSMNNINHIKVANRYDVEDLVNRRGYSLSSRATDIKPSYRFRDYEPKYHTPSKNKII